MGIFDELSSPIASIIKFVLHSLSFLIYIISKLAVTLFVRVHVNTVTHIGI